MQRRSRSASIFLMLLALLGGVLFIAQSTPGIAAPLLQTDPFSSIPAANTAGTEFDFGQVPVRGAAASQTLTIQNTSATDSITFTNVQLLDGVTFDVITTSLQAGAVIGPGGSTNFEVVCSPVEIGLITATLLVDYKYGPSETPGQAEYDISCEGVGPAADLTPDPGTPIALTQPAPAGGSITENVVTIQNTGSAGQVLNVAVDFSVNLGAFTLVSSPTLNINTGGSSQIAVRCTPPAGAQNGDVLNATLRVIHNGVSGTGVTNEGQVRPSDGLYEASYQLSCTVAAPVATLVPPPGTIAFPDTAINGSNTETIAITNDGGAPLIISNVTLSGTDAAAFSTTADPALSNLAPAATANLDVTCNPTTYGDKTATLTFQTNEPSSNPPRTYTYTLTCPVLQPGYQLLYDPDTLPNSTIVPNGGTLELGTRRIGGSITQTATIQNTGDGELEITNFTITGGGASSFSLPAGIPSPIAAGASADFDITCSPQAEGVNSATLTLTTNDPNLPAPSYTLSCNGVVPIYSSTPPPGTIAFGQVQINTSETIPLVITNTGSGPYQVTDIQLTLPPGTPQYSFTAPALPFGVGPGVNQQVDVTCTPLNLGPLAPATLTVTTNIPAPNNIYTYTLTCEGISAGYVSTPSPGQTIIIGPVLVNEQGTGTLEIRNTAAGSMNVIVDSFDDAGGIIDYTTTLNGTPITFDTSFGNSLEAGEVLLLTFTCQAPTASTYSGSIAIDHNAGNVASPASYPIDCVVQDPFPIYTTPTTNTTSGLNFGNVPVGASQTASFPVRNDPSASAPLVISNVTLGGADAGNGVYTIVTPTTFPISLLPGDQVNITVNCSPASAGLQGDVNVSVAHNDSYAPAPDTSPLSYPLTCNGVNVTNTPFYSSNPVPGATIDISTTQDTPATQPLVITNNGDANLTISGVTTTGDAQITVSPTGSFILTPGQSNTLNITCNSATAGLFTKTIEVAHNGPSSSSPATYTVNCAVSEPMPTPGYADTYVSTIRINTVVNQPPTPPQTIEISEDGTADLEIYSITSSGAPEILVTVSPPAPTTIVDDSGDTVLISLTCQSSTAGTLTKTITVEHNDGGATPPTPAVTTYNVECVVAATGSAVYTSNPPATGTSGTPLLINTETGVQGNLLVTVTNTGTAPLVIESLNPDPLATNTSQIQVTAASNPPVTLNSNSSDSFPVNVSCFSNVEGVFDKTFSITYDGGKVAYYRIRCNVTDEPDVDPEVIYQSNPGPGGTITIETFVGGGNNSGTLSISNAGSSGVLEIQEIIISSFTLERFQMAATAASLSPGQSITYTIFCDTSVAGSYTAQLTVRHNAPNVSSPTTYIVRCNVIDPAAATATAAVTATQGAATNAAAAASLTQCPPNQNFSQPLPQNAQGEFLLVNCYIITGPSSVNITLTQVLTNPYPSVAPEDISAIQGNPGLMSVWRMGSWFLVPSSYNAANSTYSFEAISGTNIYVFFYGAITEPVGSQTGSTAATTGTAAGTNTGAAPEDLIVDVTVNEKGNLLPRALMLSAGLTMLMALAFFFVNDRRKKQRSR